MVGGPSFLTAKKEGLLAYHNWAHVRFESMYPAFLRYRLPEDYTSFPLGHFGKSFVGRNVAAPTVLGED